MRIHKNVIKEEGERVTPFSKFYVYDDMLWEPVIYGGKEANTYKTIDNEDRVREIMRGRRTKIVPKVSTLTGVTYSKKVNSKSVSRFDLMDL